AGPPAKGYFTLDTSTDTTPGTEFCVSNGTNNFPPANGNVKLDGCEFKSYGVLTPGAELNAVGGGGAYCGSSTGTGVSEFISGDKTLDVKASFGWTQSAATILPVTGQTTSPAGYSVVGATSSRGTSNGQACSASGKDVITTQFQVEGFVITYKSSP